MNSLQKQKELIYTTEFSTNSEVPEIKQRRSAINFLLEYNLTDLQKKAKLIYQEFKEVDTDNLILEFLDNVVSAGEEGKQIYKYGGKEYFLQNYKRYFSLITELQDSLLRYSFSKKDKLLIIEQFEEVRSENYMGSLGSFIDIINFVGKNGIGHLKRSYSI